MKAITKEDLTLNFEFYKNKILDGKIFIYPTDTIYGIGCIGTNNNSIEKIREIKQRESKPFSIIAPNKEWIENNCMISDENKIYLNKLPGPFTFILKLNSNDSIAKSEVVGDLDCVGVRMPDNWFSEMISKLGIVFITTSVNISGEKHITSITELKEEISSKVDFIIDDGIIDGKPSTIIDLRNKDVKIIRK